jgi:hypothetical protein
MTIPHTPGLWVTDEEIVRLLGVPADKARDALHELDRNTRSGFPQKQALWGGRRYWPAVQAYFDEAYGFKVARSGVDKPWRAA